MSIKMLFNSSELCDAFFEQSKKYDYCKMCVAWCGAPENIPFLYLKDLKIKALIGTDLFNTNPKGLQKLLDMGCDLRIMKHVPNSIFHPKVYIFKKRGSKDTAIIIGSSNFSKNGFNYNMEANILLTEKDAEKIYHVLNSKIDSWYSSRASFNATKAWIKKYEKDYKTNYKNRPKTPRDIEEEGENIYGWVLNLPWDDYCNMVEENLPKYKEWDTGPEKVLTEFNKLFKFPLSIEVFNDIKNRRVLLGEKGYGTFGHIGASGRVKHIFANGTKKEKQKIVNILNYIWKLEKIDYQILLAKIEDLEKIGITIRSWGRLLLLTRPDLFLTISNDTVRSRLAGTLHMVKSHISTPKGYVEILKAIHFSPWFKEKKNMERLSKTEKFVYKNRVACMDVIFFFLDYIK